jgi:glycine/D-amino acid oxidase-like deaminating enzyme
MPGDFLRHFDENRSVWLAGKEPYVRAPPLAANRVADILVIGGGFTGMSAAYHLSKRHPEKGIALVEALEIANGASGRNGGQMLNWVHGFEPRSPEEAERIYAATREGIESIAAIAAEHRLPISMRLEGHLGLHTSARGADEAERALLKISGPRVPLRFLGRKEISEKIELEGVEGAVFDPGSGELDGLGYLRALRPVLEARGVAIFEETPVVRIREGSTLEVETTRGSIRAKAAVLATNAYTPHLGYFRSAIVPLHAHVLATEPRSKEDWARRGWRSGANFIDDRARISYGTMTASGRAIFGGGSNAAYEYRFGNGTSSTGPGERGRQEMRARLLAYLPRVQDVEMTHSWSGPVALTLSRLPAMGVRGAHRNLYFAVGYSGHGITLANLAGKVLTDLYSGSDERWRGLPFYQQKLRYVPPEPLRFLGYHAFTKLTGRSPRVYERS